MASTSSHPIHIEDNDERVPLPKPPSSSSVIPVDQHMAPERDAGDVLVVLPSTDPPPPYPSAHRGSRNTRSNTARSVRRTLQTSEDSQLSTGFPDSGGELESSPLIGGGQRRRRTLSHSSTAHSVHSLAQTVLSSSRTVMSLFQSEPEYTITLGSPTRSAPNHSFYARAKRYFRPLTRKAYYAALVHLLLINFSFELAAWIYLFVGTLTGTTLLITLPLGVIICFLDLLGARIFARGEIALQMRFHGPLSISPPNPPHPIFSRMRTPPPTEAESNPERVDNWPVPFPETSFLRLCFLMFRDPTSYQALFYFLVIKPGLTLLIAIAIIILVPPAFILVIPAPAVLRAIRRVGIWQAEVAIDALS